MLNKKKNIVFTLLLLSMPWYVQAGTPLYNPLEDSTKDFPTLIGRVIRGMLGVVGAVALIMIVIGGITWMTSAGNADRVRRGRDTLVWAVVGLVAIFLSYAVVNFIFNAMVIGGSGS